MSKRARDEKDDQGEGLPLPPGPGPQEDETSPEPSAKRARHGDAEAQPESDPISFGSSAEEDESYSDGEKDQLSDKAFLIKPDGTGKAVWLTDRAKLIGESAYATVDFNSHYCFYVADSIRAPENHVGRALAKEIGVKHTRDGPAWRGNVLVVGELGRSLTLAQLTSIKDIHQQLLEKHAATTEVAGDNKEEEPFDYEALADKFEKEEKAKEAKQKASTALALPTFSDADFEGEMDFADSSPSLSLPHGNFTAAFLAFYYTGSTKTAANDAKTVEMILRPRLDGACDVSVDVTTAVNVELMRKNRLRMTKTVLEEMTRAAEGKLFDICRGPLSYLLFKPSQFTPILEKISAAQERKMA